MRILVVEDELEARIRCLLRMKYIQEDNEIEYKNLKVNIKSRRAYRACMG